jgi:hypothetical protein
MSEKRRKEFENLRKSIRDDDRIGSAQHVKQTFLNPARMKELIVGNRHVTFRDNGLHWSCTSEVYTGLKWREHTSPNSTATKS